MTARLLMIALDGADGRLLDAASADGAAPNLATLRARGAAKRLSPPPGLTDDALWASFQYGVELGEHGRYNNLVRLDDGRWGAPQLNELDREAFWDGLAAQGLRVAVLDVPKCRPPRPINGVHLTDWLVHGRAFSEPLSHPPSLAAEVLARFGPAPPSRCGYHHPNLTDDGVGEAVRDLANSVAKKRAAGLACLEAEPWDLFIIGFKEMHCCCHTFWDFADPDHPDHDAARTARLGDPVRAILKDIDEAVGDLAAAAGPTAQIVVFSTSDFEPNGSLMGLLPKIIVRLNKQLGRSGWRCQMVPYHDSMGALRVLADRRIGDGSEPCASAKPAVVDEIETLLGELVDAETGTRVISSFTRPSAQFQGARADSLPDLLLHYRSGAFPCAAASPRLGRLEAEQARMRPGNHAPGGILITAGEAACAAAARVDELADLGAAAAIILTDARQPTTF